MRRTSRRRGNGDRSRRRGRGARRRPVRHARRRGGLAARRGRGVRQRPVDVNRSPVLPAFAGPSPLVVVSSSSGNTAETLAAFHEAAARGCRILAITGGGTLGEECAARGFAAVRVPGGFQPRAAVGHLTFAMLGALEAAGLTPRLADDVAEVVSVLEAGV